MNSSPPNRTGIAVSPATSLSTEATQVSSWSPAACPCVSLTALKWSRSSVSREKGKSVPLVQ